MNLIILAFLIFVLQAQSRGEQGDLATLKKLHQSAQGAIEKRQYEEAYSNLIEAKSLLQNIHDDSLQTINHLLLSKLYMHRQHFDSALFHGQSAYDLAVLLDTETLTLRSNLAIGEALYYAAGDSHTALYYFEEAERILREIDSKWYDYEVLYNLLVANRAVGKIDNAEQYGLLLEALIAKEDSLLGSATIANAFYVIGRNYQEMYDPTALKYFLKADSIMENKAGPGNFYQINYYYPQIAIYYNDQKDHKTALGYLKKIEQLTPNSYQSNAQNIINQAWVYYRLKEYQIADSLAKMYLPLAANRFDSVFAYKTLGKIALEEHDPDQALDYLRNALNTIYPKRTDADLPPLDQLADPYDEPEIYGYIGLAYLSKTDQPAREKNLDTAYQYLWFALKASLQNRSIARHHNAQVTLSRHIKQFYSWLLDYYYTRFQMQGTRAYIDTAAMLINHAKATIIKSKARLFQNNTIPDSLKKVKSQLLSQINDMKQKGAKSDLIFQQFNTLESVNNQIESYQNIYDEAFFQEFSEVPPSHLLINFLWGEEYLYVISKGTRKRFLKIPNTENLSAQLGNFIQYLKSPQIQAFQDYEEAGLFLYQTLLKPIFANSFPEQLIIIPDDKLLLLPFEALPVNNSGQNFYDTDYVLHRTNVSYSLFENEVTEQKLNNEHGAVSFAYNAVEEKHLPRYLGKVELESRLLANFFDTKELVGRLATETNYKALSQSHTIHHLALHGTAKEGTPYLAFRTEEDKTNDGKLYEYEIFNMSIPARLVLLTACESSQGEIASSEGAISLSRAFLAAGVHSVISSLWTLNDDASLSLLDEFLKQYEKSENPIMALNEAKRSYLASADEIKAHPYFWAGLVGFSNRQDYSKPGYSLLIILLGILLISLIALYSVSMRSKRMKINMF